jgi:hypothetical protein
MMPKEDTFEPDRIAGMQKLLDDLKQKDITLDWVIHTAPLWARDASGEHGDGTNCPPKLEAWNGFLTKLAKEFSLYNESVVLEFWNEPEISKSWSGMAGSI